MICFPFRLKFMMSSFPPQAAKAPEPAPPLIPKEDPYAFSLKQTVFVDLKALPKVGGQGGM